MWYSIRTRSVRLYITILKHGSLPPFEYAIWWLTVPPKWNLTLSYAFLMIYMGCDWWSDTEKWWMYWWIKAYVTCMSLAKQRKKSSEGRHILVSSISQWHEILLEMKPKEARKGFLYSNRRYFETYWYSGLRIFVFLYFRYLGIYLEVSQIFQDPRRPTRTPGSAIIDPPWRRPNFGQLSRPHALIVRDVLLW